MKIYKINITGYKEKIYDVFNVDLDKAKKHLKQKGYKINSYELIDMELEKTENYYDYINDDGFLSTKYTDKKPSTYAEERVWNEMYQITTGNNIPKGGIL